MTLKDLIGKDLLGSCHSKPTPSGSIYIETMDVKMFPGAGNIAVYIGRHCVEVLSEDTAITWNKDNEFLIQSTHSFDYYIRLA